MKHGRLRLEKGGSAGASPYRATRAKSSTGRARLPRKRVWEFLRNFAIGASAVATPATLRVAIRAGGLLALVRQSFRNADGEKRPRSGLEVLSGRVAEGLVYPALKRRAEVSCPFGA